MQKQFDALKKSLKNILMMVKWIVNNAIILSQNV
jgi:hypothetical protein